MTCRAARYAVQRSNRVRLKADAFVLLGLIAGKSGDEYFSDEIAEMRVRLKPPTGAAAPIKWTGYTDDKGRVRK